uniref:Cytochrome b561 domain-containing protein n=8 Tax=Solanum TaxID=4107 RepID=A0A3Q7FNI9_SOLLC
MVTYKFHQYQVVGRALPTETDEHPKIYRMKLWATNEVRAKSKFWYFLRKLKKVKKSNGQMLAINEIFEKNPTTIKNYGIWLRYQSRTGYHNMYKEYRDTTLNGGVEQMYTEMASRHRVRHHCIQIIKTATIPAKLCKRESTKQFHDSKIKFPLVFKKVRPPSRKLKTTYKATKPNLFMFDQQWCLSFVFHQYQVVGRALPTETDEHPKIYRMKLWATNEVRAKSKFWYFLRKLKKVKKSNGQMLAINEIFEKNPTTIKNYGIWLRYQSRTGYHNMYKEYRDTTLNGGVEQMYTEMASRHRVRHHCIQIIKTATIPAKLCKRESTKQFHDSKIKFPLVFKKVRPPSRKLKTTYKATKPNLFMIFDIEIHGILLWASMGFLMPAGILTIRFSNTEECSTTKLKILFYVHGTLQVLSVVLATAGAVLSIKSFENLFNNTHQRIGLALYIAVYVQFFMGFRRPMRGSKGRSVWYFFHWLLGTTICLAGIINTYTGLNAYNQRTSKPISLWTIIFTAQISFMGLFYLFQDKWEYIQKQGVILNNNETTTPQVEIVVPQNDEQKMIMRTESGRKSNALGTFFSRHNVLNKLFQQT